MNYECVMTMRSTREFLLLLLSMLVCMVSQLHHLLLLILPVIPSVDVAVLMITDTSSLFNDIVFLFYGFNPNFSSSSQVSLSISVSEEEENFMVDIISIKYRNVTTSTSTAKHFDKRRKVREEAFPQETSEKFQEFCDGERNQ